MALMILFDDLTTMLIDGITADAKQNNRRDPATFTPALTKLRLQSLEAWSKEPNHSKWSFTGASYNRLLHAVTGLDPCPPSTSLPGSEQREASPYKLGTYIATFRSRSAPAPPLVRGSSFKYVIPVLLDLLQEQAQFASPAATFDQWCGSTFALVLATFRVHFLPWRSGTTIFSTDARGSYSSWDSFITLTAANAAAAGNAIAGPSSSQQQSSSVAQGPKWVIGTRSIGAITAALSHTNIPDDYHSIEGWVNALGNLSTKDPGYSIWNDLWLWVVVSYNRRNKVHHLALVAAVFLNCLAPDYEVAQPPSKPYDARLYAWTRKQPTRTKPNPTQAHPGSDIFATWFLYAMAMLNPNSPLRAPLPKHGRQSLGAHFIEPLGQQAIRTTLLPDQLLRSYQYPFHQGKKASSRQRS